MRHCSPLRYPGGKGKLTNFFVDIIKENHSLEGGTYVEPFAGGAGVAINLLLRDYVTKIAINDADPSIYAFWKSAVNRTEEFIEAIDKAVISVNEWDRQTKIQTSKDTTSDLFELGFSTFYLNRTNRSGILNAGMIGGRNQMGEYKMDVRFNKEELKRRIRSIGEYSSSISVTGIDAIEFLNADKMKKFDMDTTLVYIDPPYYIQGSHLYMNHYKSNDHKNLRDSIRSLKHRWVLSYDNVTQIRKLYCGRKHINIPMIYSMANKTEKENEIFYHHKLLKMPSVSSGIGVIRHTTASARPIEASALNHSET